MSIQDNAKNERIHLTIEWLDSRRIFIEQFLRYKFNLENKLPTTWQEAIDWLSEFDIKRNEADIAYQEAFYEHMKTCVRPVMWVKK